MTYLLLALGLLYLLTPTYGGPTVSLAEPSPRRHVPVRLCDLPETVRLRGARQACAHEPDPDEKLGILTAALVPSDRTYWVAEWDEARLMGDAA